MSDFKPGDVIKGDSGAEYVLGDAIGLAPESGSACDSDQPASYVDGHCRCMVCARCGHHTGNSHQGHYWSYCAVTGTKRDFHFCCPGDCELEAGAS